MSGVVPPGWRTDPQDSSLERWWSGRGWTEHIRPASLTDLRWPLTAPIAEVHGAPHSRRRGRIALLLEVLLVVGAVALVLLAGLASNGVGGLLVILAIAALVVGGVALVRGRSRTFRIRSRGVAAAVLGGGLVTLVVGGAAAGATGSMASQGTTNGSQSALAAAALTADSTTASTETAAASSTPTSKPARGSALAVLATLPVKGRAPMTGYARTAKFGTAWLDVDRNGCDTRNDILRRDLRNTTGRGCRVLTGVLHDPYTRATISFRRGQGTSMKVQIDHVVALGAAWRSGAQRLDQAQRIDLANDPINLFAVDGPTNERKSDGDAATWLPPNKAFRCTYVAHQVGVKKAYGLWVTRAERDAMRRVLSKCPDVKAPTSRVSHLVPPTVATKSAPRPSATTRPKPTASTGPTDPRYSYCYVAKAHHAHTPYYRGKDPEYAWYTDRDGDGVVCE